MWHERVPENRVGRRMSRLDRLLFLRSLPTYEDLPPEEACAIADRMRERIFARGAYLHRQGAPLEAIQFVVRGRVEARRHGIPMRILGARSAVGGLGILAGDLDGFDCVALEETVTLELPASDAEDVLEESSALLVAVARATAEELVRVRASTGEGAGYPARLPPARLLSPAPLDTIGRIAAFRSTALFAEAPVEALTELARSARELHAGPGQWLFREGEPSARILVVLSGAVACERTMRPQRFRFGAGDAVGAIDAIAGLGRWYGARAEHDLVALDLPTEQLLEALEDSFGLSMTVVRALSVDLLRLHDERLGLCGGEP